MSRPVDWTPLWEGSDPVPGDPEIVERTGRHYSEVAEAINTAAQRLREIAEGTDQRSDAVDAFRNNAREVAENISKAYERYAGVGEALSGYAAPLRRAQHRSLELLRKAKEAEVTRLNAERIAGEATARVLADPVDADTTDDRRVARQMQAAADEAAVVIGRAREDLQDILRIRAAAARHATAKVEEVKDSGGLNDSFWDNTAGVVKTIVKVADWVAAIAGIAALLLGWVPILGQFLVAVALIAALVSLLGNLYLAGSGHGDWGDVLVSAITLATFGIGKVAIGAFKISAAGVRGASRLEVPNVLARRLLGDNPMGHIGAQAAARASQRHGFLPSGSQAWQTLRGVPGQVGRDVANIRNFRPHHFSEGWQQLRSGPGGFNPLQFMGEHGRGQAAEQLRDISQISQSVLRSGSVAPHVVNMYGQAGVFAGTYAYGMTDLLANSVPKLSESPAGELNLPDEQISEPAGTGR